MNQKKIKIILYLPLTLFFIANLFYFSLPAKAADVCVWMIENAATNGGLCVKGILGAGSRSESYATCAAQLGASPTTSLCCCKQETPAASSGVNASMPKLNIPDINLQVTIPGLNLTKGNAIECKEVNGKKVCNFPWIGEYIAGIYKYAIGIVGILAAVVLMIGGVLWIIAGGNATMIGEAKAWIGASLIGLVIALCSYLILYQVNPALTVFAPLGITQVVKAPEAPMAGGCQWGAENATSCPSGYAQTMTFSKCPTGGDLTKQLCCCQTAIDCGQCKSVDSGSCAISNLSAFGQYAAQASAICNVETSNGNRLCNPPTCGPMTTCSVGLFQINMPSHCNNNGIGYSGSYATAGDCTSAINGPQLTDCYNKLYNSTDNINYAYKLFQQSGYKWTWWGSYNNRTTPSAAKCAGCF